MMLEDEIKAVGEKVDGAKIAKEYGNEEVYRFFDRALHDETRHKEKLKEILSKIMEKY
jgi:rubrerythrin